MESGLCSPDILELEGGGAAGGAGAGAAVFLGGRLRPGAEVVLDAADFDGLLKEAALVVTGEGKFDHTSLNGKAVGAAAARAKSAGVPVLVIAGAADVLPPELLSEYGITAILCSQRGAVRPEELAGRAKGDLYEAAHSRGAAVVRGAGVRVIQPKAAKTGTLVSPGIAVVWFHGASGIS